MAAPPKYAPYSIAGQVVLITGEDSMSKVQAWQPSEKQAGLQNPLATHALLPTGCRALHVCCFFSLCRRICRHRRSMCMAFCGRRLQAGADSAAAGAAGGAESGHHAALCRACPPGGHGCAGHGGHISAAARAAATVSGAEARLGAWGLEGGQPASIWSGRPAPVAAAAHGWGGIPRLRGPAPSLDTCAGYSPRRCPSCCPTRGWRWAWSRCTS